MTMSDNPFHASAWRPLDGFAELTDITYHRHGHSLHSTCDLTLASREHARFKQTDADVGSFGGGDQR